MTNVEKVNSVQSGEEYINVYFNKNVNTSRTISGVKANYNINFENILIDRINNAKETIDICAYEINLPGIVEALINKASEGVRIRLIADAKKPDEDYYIKRDKTMRLYLEKLMRGKDGVIGSDDDVIIFSDSPMFFVTDSYLREAFRLPKINKEKDVITIGNSTYRGYILCEGESKGEEEYFSPGTQMHNKFAIFDGELIWTGSWNFTITGTYGEEENIEKEKLNGNIQHCIEIKDKDVADAFTTEFEEMWGGSEEYPNPDTSDFASRKADNTKHVFYVNDIKVEIYFSPSDNAIDRVIELIDKSRYNAYFSMYTFSHDGVIEALNRKFEDDNGKRTGYRIKGILDEDSWGQRWSASQKIMSTWDNIPAIVKDNYEKKFHCKTMILDGGTGKDVVITGSMNFSKNGDEVNDENTIIIHDEIIADLFLQEFYTRFLEYAN